MAKDLMQTLSKCFKEMSSTSAQMLALMISQNFKKPKASFNKLSFFL